jgi:hypothetical protein
MQQQVLLKGYDRLFVGVWEGIPMNTYSYRVRDLVRLFVYLKVILLGPIAIANAQGEAPRASSATESAATNVMLEGGKPEDSTPSTPRASGDTETGGSAKWWDIVVKYIVPIVAAMYRNEARDPIAALRRPENLFRARAAPESFGGNGRAWVSAADCAFCAGKHYGQAQRCNCRGKLIFVGVLRLSAIRIWPLELNDLMPRIS